MGLPADYTPRTGPATRPWHYVEFPSPGQAGLTGAAVIPSPALRLAGARRISAGVFIGGSLCRALSLPQHAVPPDSASPVHSGTTCGGSAP